MRLANKLTVVVVASSVMFLGACSIHEHKGEEGEQKVEIKVPFAKINVGNDTKAADTGLSAYPGARVKVDNDHDSNRANIQIGGEDFGVKVVVAKYVTDDPPTKVISFYRDDLKRYGKVLECPKGITETRGKDEKEIRCSDSGSDESGKMALAVGVPDRQHVVSIKPDGKGTEFDLVYVNVRGKDHDTL